MNVTYFKHRTCVVAIASEDNQGAPHIGTGFHIGDGLIVTARHVIERMRDIKISDLHKQNIKIKRIYYPSRPLVDIAILQTDFDFSCRIADIHGQTWEKTDHLPLGVEWDDCLDDSLVLFDAVIMGYPPVPTGFSTLVAIRAQVNAVVDQYPVCGEHPPPCFILSGIPRGGFSGAPMLVDGGDDSFVLGVVTTSLVRNHQVHETGFMAATSIESLLSTLHEHSLYPTPNALAVKAFASELTSAEEKEFLGKLDNDKKSRVSK